MNFEPFSLVAQFLFCAGGVAIIASGLTILGAVLIIFSFLFNTKN